MSHLAFKDLNKQLISSIYNDKRQSKTWKGFRLCAIDGTTLRLPNSTNIIKTFGMHKSAKEKADCPMALGSIFYDVLNKMVIDSSIDPIGFSERKAAQNHLQFATKNDLVLFDRGYSGYPMMAYLESKNIQFCIREKTNQSKYIQRFIEAGKQDEIIILKPNKYSVETCHKMGIKAKNLSFRLIRVDLKTGVEVLITSLTDSVAYPSVLFQKLYFKRWGIEENYKKMKLWLEIERFSGKSALSVKQDFYAKILSLNLTTLLANQAQELVEKNTQKLKKMYQINFAQSLSKMKHEIIRLLRASKIELKNLIDEIVIYMSKTFEIVRKGRTFNRKRKGQKNNVNYYNYVSCL